jgi:hypothetical protein
LSCKQELDSLDQHLSKTATDKVYLHQAELIFNKEIEKTIEYQNIIELANNLKECYEEHMRCARERVASIIVLTLPINSINVSDKDKNDLLNKIEVLTTRLQELNYDEKRSVVDNFIDTGLYNQTLIDEVMHKKGDITFNKKIKCPLDNCKGFLNDNYYCSLCENHICNKCKTKLEENHECKNEDIEVVELLEKKCKTCPNCGINIQRSKGCDQMFCVSCKTKFNYNTGQIYNSDKYFHNPHYSEFKQNQTKVKFRPGINPLSFYLLNVYNYMNYNNDYEGYPYVKTIREYMIEYFKNEKTKKLTLINIKINIKANIRVLQMKNIKKDFVEKVYNIFIKIAVQSKNKYVLTRACVSSKDVYDELLSIYNDTFNKIKKMCEQDKIDILWPYIAIVPNGFPKFEVFA